MARLSIISLISLGFITVLSPLRAKAEDRSHTLVLFGASWCAPCIGELRNLDALAAAHGSGRIVIAWSDAGIEAIRFDRPETVEVASMERANRLRAAYAPDIAGYPYAVMLDGQGRSCAQWARSVTPRALAEMRRICDRHPR
ncbi:TlpA family protein disulfide reductase [Novosphingobium naphthalenivorans]|uniref:TlpA family protein disulfide reductase n=1 Tax=Novosphingobium naphthalenivorans TaxID=273168 RepID=UPI000B1BE744|nr:hypothetical protein [Novosphingobium naphthalenivorans]